MYWPVIPGGARRAPGGYGIVGAVPPVEGAGSCYVAPGLDLAAWGFFLYGLTQLVVPPVYVPCQPILIR